MSEPTIHRPRPLTWALLFALILATRVAFLLSPYAGNPLLPDELEMTRTTLDRFLGVPPTSLAWPGGTFQMLAVPAIGAQMTATARPSPEGIARFLSEAYRDPADTLIVLRLLVAALFALAAAALARAVYSRSGRPVPALCFGLLLATAPPVWFYSHVALGDGVALALAIGATAALLARPERASAYAIAGALLGLAVASKIVIVLLFPLVYAFALARGDRSVRRFAAFVAAQTAGFVAGCPFLWTDPLRLVKSIAGNLTRAGEPAGLFGGLAFIQAHAVPLWLMALTALAVAWGIRRRDWIATGGLVVTVLVAVVVAARGKVLGAQYFVPLTAACWIYIATRFREGDASRPIARLALAAAIAFALGMNALGYAAISKDVDRTRADLTDTVDDVAVRVDADRRIALPYELLAAISRDLSLVPVTRYLSGKSCLRLARAADAAADPIERDLASLTGLGFSAEGARALAGSFDEDERALVARALAMAITAPADGLDAVFFTDQNPHRLGLLSSTEATDALDRGIVDWLLTDEPQPGRTPARVYDSGLFLYRGEGAASGAD